MKKLAGFILNNLHITAVVLAGISYPYADNFLNLMNVLAVLMTFVALLAAGVSHAEPSKEKMEPLIKNFNSKFFAFKQYIFYVPMFVLTAWFGFWGTFFIIVLLGLSVFVAVVVIKTEYDNLTKTN